MLRRLLLVLLLAGCTTTAKYDSAEYKYYVEIYLLAQETEAACGNPAKVQPLLERMYAVEDKLDVYTYHRPDEDSKAFSLTMTRLIRSSNTIAKSSVGFCREATKNIQDAARRIMQTLGRREQ